MHQSHQAHGLMPLTVHRTRQATLFSREVGMRTSVEPPTGPRGRKIHVIEGGKRHSGYPVVMSAPLTTRTWCTVFIPHALASLCLSL